MASTSAASPSSTSAGSPSYIAPAPPTIAAAANNASMASNASTSVSFIGPSRHYTIPPRPRPGRKPATDTPPTKRKAQNRAAQRAFRERRAARVGELEEQLKETEEERQKRESEMHDRIVEQGAQISDLLDDVESLGRERASLQHRYDLLEQKFEKMRQEKEDFVMELAYLRNGAQSSGTNAVPLPPRRQRKQHRAQAPSAFNLQLEPLGCGNCTTASNCLCVEATMSIASSGCGNCTHDSDCQCLEETLDAPTLDESSQLHLKRPRLISPEIAEVKRPRVSIEQPTLTEIDFTAQFAAKPMPSDERQSQDQPTLSRPAGESCGFCDEGTYCVCAEAAAASSNAEEKDQENRLAPILNGVHEVTPPPSENDVIGVSSEINGYKLPLLHPNHRMHHALQATGSLPVLPGLLVSSTGKPETQSSSPCQNGPGSCKQCQDDPKSGLFCRSLAAMRDSNASGDGKPSGCCGGASSGRGCCKDVDKAPILSCADTYKTLASHKNFDEASDDLGNWLPKLHASSGRYPGRAPLDIEAASVMNVIKYFDVRFGRN